MPMEMWQSVGGAAEFSSKAPPLLRIEKGLLIFITNDGSVPATRGELAPGYFWPQVGICT